MGVEVQVFNGPKEAGAALAARIAERLSLSPPGAAFLLGCPGGRTPRPVYAALAGLAKRRRLDLSKLIIVMMDEYLVGPADALRLASPEAHYSCRGFANRDIRAVLNKELPIEHHVRPENIWLPDPVDPAAYDRRIEDAGGIDVFILASGASDGHVAFNPPGSPPDAPTRIVRLAEQTRRDNLVTFPDFDSLDSVPSYGLTIGTGTIARQSRETGMLLWGPDKRQAFERIAGADAYDPDWPATVAVACRNSVVYADKQAAGEAG